MSDLTYETDLPPWRALAFNLRRNRRNMLCAFLGSAILGGSIATIMPAAYRSTSELMVRLGQEYLVNADPATSTAFMERKEMVVSEVAMLTAPELAVRVIQETGLERLYPSIAHAIDPSIAGSDQDARDKALLKFQKHLKVLPVKDSTLLTLAFTHGDREIAAEVLKRLTSDYLEMRKKHFEYSGDNALSSELTGTRLALEAASNRLAAFRREAGVADFDAQMVHLIEEKALLVTARDKVANDIPALAAQISSLDASLGSIGGWVRLRVEEGPTDAAREVDTDVAKLKLHRDELALQFKGPVPQIIDIDHQISLAQALQRSYDRDRDTKLSSGRPTSYDSIETALKEAQGSLTASQARLQALVGQIGDVNRAIAQLDGHRAEIEQLQHEQKISADAFFQAAKRASEAHARDQLMEAARPNVEVVQEPRVPYEETLTRFIIAAMGVVMGAILAALIGYVDGLGRTRPNRQFRY